MQIITQKELYEKYQSDLRTLQSSCLHKETTWVPYCWSPGHFSGEVEVCNVCDLVVDKRNSTPNSILTPLSGYAVLNQNDFS